MPAVSAAEPVLIGEYSYESFVEDDYIVYTNFSDDPYERTPEGTYWGVYNGMVRHGNRLPLSNIYLHNISSGETIPVYMSECKSIGPWIENGTIYWYEDRSYQVFYKRGDPNPPGYYIYSVPIGNISVEAAENYSLLSPDVRPAEAGAGFDKSTPSRPDFSSGFIETVQENESYHIYYNDPETGNRIEIAEGQYFEYLHPPQLIDGRIFWEDYRSGNSQLYVYDLSSGQDYVIAPQVFSQYDLSVDGDIISWNTYGGDVYYADFSGLIEEIPPEEAPVKSPEPTESGAGIAVLVISISASILIFTAAGDKKR